MHADHARSLAKQASAHTHADAKVGEHKGAEGIEAKVGQHRGAEGIEARKTRQGEANKGRGKQCNKASASQTVQQGKREPNRTHTGQAPNRTHTGQVPVHHGQAAEGLPATEMLCLRRV